MAQQVITSLIDDLDGSEAEETVEFGLDGKTYEIDLSTSNARTLRDAFEAYRAAARRAGGIRRKAGGGGMPARRPAVDKEQNQAIREWAIKQGMKIADRGRIPQEVLDAFNGRPGVDYRPLSEKNQVAALRVVHGAELTEDQKIIKWYQDEGRKFPSNFKVGGKPTGPMVAAYNRAQKQAVNA